MQKICLGKWYRCYSGFAELMRRKLCVVADDDETCIMKCCRHVLSLNCCIDVQVSDFFFKQHVTYFYTIIIDNSCIAYMLELIVQPKLFKQRSLNKIITILFKMIIIKLSFSKYLSLNLIEKLFRSFECCQSRKFHSRNKNYIFSFNFRDLFVHSITHISIGNFLCQLHEKWPLTESPDILHVSINFPSASFPTLSLHRFLGSPRDITAQITCTIPSISSTLL